MRRAECRAAVGFYAGRRIVEGVLVLLTLAGGLSACGPNEGSRAGENLVTSDTEAVTSGQCPNGATVEGIDVSYYQGSVNWASVKSSGRQFGIARISDGSYMDTQFDANWAGMKSAGIIRGAYQFFEPAGDAVAQANIVVSKVGHLGAGDLPVMLDVEVTGGQSASTITSKIHQWMNVVESGTGKRPMIYTGAYFWDDNVKTADFASYPLVIAWYGTNCPGTPNAWGGNWTFHQYNDNGNIPGVSSNPTDVDVFNGSLAQLQAFAGTSSNLVMFGRHVGNNADGRLEVFAHGSAGDVVHDWQTAPNGNWSGWSSHAGAPSGEPVVGADADGRLEVFYTGADHNVYHRWETPDGPWYSSWVSLGEGLAASDPAVNNDADGRIELFVRKGDGHVAHIWQTSPNGVFSSWYELAPTPVRSRPAVGRNADGRLEAFAVGSDGTLVHSWQTAANGGWTSDWSSFGGIQLVGNPAVGPNADGRLEAFATGADGSLHHIVQLPGGGWSSWLTFGVAIKGDVAVGRNADGRLEVFARTTQDTLWHAWQTSPNGSWSGGEVFTGTVVRSNPDVGNNADGRLQVFYLTDGGQLDTLFEQVGSGWSSVLNFGGSLASFN